MRTATWKPKSKIEKWFILLFTEDGRSTLVEGFLIYFSLKKIEFLLKWREAAEFHLKKYY